MNSCHAIGLGKVLGNTYIAPDGVLCARNIDQEDTFSDLLSKPDIFHLRHYMLACYSLELGLRSEEKEKKKKSAVCRTDEKQCIYNGCIC